MKSEVQVEPAGLIRRFGAYAIDAGVGLVAAMVVLFGMRLLSVDPFRGILPLLWMEATLALLPHVVIPILLGGPTLGHRAMRVRVIDREGLPVTSPLILGARGLARFHLTAGCLPVTVVGALLGRVPMPRMPPGGPHGRRLPHDLVCGTWVAYEGRAVPAAR